jgi:hypothetical protein
MSGRDYSPGVFGAGGQLLRVADLAGTQLRDNEEDDIALFGAGASSSSSSAASAAGLRAPSRAGVIGWDGNMPAGHGEEEVDDDEEGEKEEEEEEVAPLASDEALDREDTASAAAAAPGAAAEPAIETLFASRDTVLAHIISVANKEGAGIVDGASGRKAFDTPPGPPDPPLLKALADKLEENAEAAGKKVAKNVCFVGGAKSDLVRGEPAPSGSVACATSLNAPLHHEGMTTPGTSTRQRFPALGILEGEYKETVRTIRVVELLHEPYGTAAKDGEAHGRAGLVLPPGYLLTEAFPCETPITELGASVTIPKNVEVTRIMLLIMLANGVRFLNVASARAATCFRSIVSDFLPSAKMTSVDIHPAGYDEGIRADVITGVNLQAACTSAGVAWPKDLPAPAPFDFVMVSTDHYCVAGRQGNPARMSLALAVTLALGGAQVTPEQIEQSRDALQLDIDENPGAYYITNTQSGVFGSPAYKWATSTGKGTILSSAMKTRYRNFAVYLSECAATFRLADDNEAALKMTAGAVAEGLSVVLRRKRSKVRAYMDTCSCGPCGGESLVAGNGTGAPVHIMWKRMAGADGLPIASMFRYTSCQRGSGLISAETDAAAVGDLKDLAVSERLISRDSFPYHNLLGVSMLDMRRQAMRVPSNVRAYMDTCGCGPCGGKSLVAGNGTGAPVRILPKTKGLTTGADSLPIGHAIEYRSCSAAKAYISSETDAVAVGDLKALAVSERLISRDSFPYHNLLGVSMLDMQREATRGPNKVRAYMDTCGCGPCGGKSLVEGNGGGAPVRILPKTEGLTTGADSLPIGRVIEYCSCSAARAYISSETDAVAVGDLKALAVSERLISRDSFPTHNLLGINKREMRREAMRDPSKVRAYMDTCGCGPCGGKSLVAGNGGGAPVHIKGSMDAAGLLVGNNFSYRSCTVSATVTGTCFDSLKKLALDERLVSPSSFSLTRVGGVVMRRKPSAFRAYVDCCGCGKCEGDSLIQPNGTGAPVRFKPSRGEFKYAGCGRVRGDSSVHGSAAEDLQRLAISEGLADASTFVDKRRTKKPRT